QTEGVGRGVSARVRVVVAPVVVVEAGFRVVVLAGETQRTVGCGVDRRCCRCCCPRRRGRRGRRGRRARRRCREPVAPEAGGAAPGDLALWRDELGRGADQVGDDRVETLVDHLLRRVGVVRPAVLRYRGPGARLVVPRRRGDLIPPGTGVLLLGQGRAVPGEAGLLAD